ncbi:MAG: class I SAM-dependent methyltransferase [Bacillales bacterium]|jgi:tRNA (adenine22-N1)-methyltransferase|nr:class I SAM-dependent methyltransferase [Bacillales bacterium]
MNLSIRLKLIASCLPYSSRVVDVGCDHGLLDLYILENRIASKVIALDNKEGPLNQARLNFDKDKNTYPIEFVLSEGLEKVDANEFDAIVIAGMGGNNIANILLEAKNKLNNTTAIIVNPTNNFPYVRKVINKLGFKIHSEDYIMESNKTSVIIKFVRGTEKLDARQIKYGKFYDVDKSYFFVEYLKSELKLCDKLVRKIPDKTSKKVITAAEDKIYLQTLLDKI